MTLRHLDFPSGQPGIYGTSTSFMDDGLYAVVTSIALVDDPSPSITGNVPLITGAANTDGQLRFVLPATHATAGIASRVYLANIPTGNGDNPVIHQFRDGSNAVLVSIVVTATGAIAAYRGGDNTNWESGSATLLGTSSSPNLVANSWQHVETKCLFSATVGTVEVRVEGVAVLTLTNQNTGAGPCAQVACVNAYSGSGVGTSYYFKDLVVWDGAGSVNNNFLGSVQVRELTTSSDVSLNWTTSAGATGWDLIDEAPPNDDTDYIYAPDPPPAAAKFGLTNLPADVTSVKGLYTVVRSSKTDGGDGSMQVGVISGASTGLGTDRAITTTYTYWTDMFELDPATSSSWTPSAVDGAQLQLNRTV